MTNEPGMNRLAPKGDISTLAYLSLTTHSEKEIVDCGWFIFNTKNGVNQNEYYSNSWLICRCGRFSPVGAAHPIL